MAQYEQLLSKDPIGAFEKIEKDYHLYFQTSYKFSDRNPLYKDLDDRKNEELRKNDNLHKKPLCELTPKYVTENVDLLELCDPTCREYKYNGTQLPDNFADFIACGLMRDEERTRQLGRFATYNPYQHQFEMLCKGYGQSKNVLITSGTGSGKTESFMLPLLASLLSEVNAWHTTYGSQSYNANWWLNQEDPNDPTSKYKACQRDGEQRPSAIRSLLLYPMNALVADQVGRLRKALDSDDVRQFLGNQCGGHRIFFGSYNGSTLKENRKEDTKTSHQLLEEIANQATGLLNAAQNGKCEPDDIYVAPRLDCQSFTSEMLVREDMQNTPPDILITNVSMLSIMLMRLEEQGMLDKTHDYFQNNPDAIFHLVVDELHLHRGTAGAEVAYLLRMFLKRIGVPPMKVINGTLQPNPQLRIYASSASIDNNPQKYLEDFFGVYDPTHSSNLFEIQTGYDVIPSSSNTLDYSKFDQFYLANKYGKPYYVQDKTERAQTETDFLSNVGYVGTLSQFVDDYAEQIYYDLLTVAGATWNLGAGQFTNRPKTFEVSEMTKLPGNPSDDAIQGMLIFRGAVKHPMLPSIRFHQFYKYIEGLWGELQPDSLGQGPIGELSYQPKEIASNGQHKMLELLRCECCGELFIGGNCNSHSTPFAMTLNSPDITRIPNMQATPMVQRKKYDDYAVFWPSSRKANNTEHILTYPDSDDVLKSDVSHGGDPHNSQTQYGFWKEAWLNTCDGTIETRNSKSPSIHGFVYECIGLQNAQALPCQCPSCLKNYSRRDSVKSPIRSFRTGMGRNNQLLCKELLYQLDPKDDHAPKLIGFSDSRQDAAEQSKLIAKEHYRDMLRLAFIQIIKAKQTATPANLTTAKSVVTSMLAQGHQWNNIQPAISNLGLSAADLNHLQVIITSTLADKIAQINAYSPTQQYVDLNNLICKGGQTTVNGELVQKMLDLGINPSGATYAELHPNNHDYWDKVYDFSNKCLTDTNLIARTINTIQAHIFENCFGQYMKVNTEEAGLGYVAGCSVTNNNAVSTLQSTLQYYLTKESITIENVLNAFIRVFGDKYRYSGTSFRPAVWANFSKYVKEVKNAVSKLESAAGLTVGTLGNQLHAALRAVAIDQNGLLQINKPLRFSLAHEGDDYYQCEHCGRIHLHRGMGLCTNLACLKQLPMNPTGKVETLWKKHYISHDIYVEPHNPKRLHPEELSGQTDNQTERLLQFKDIILDQSLAQPHVRKIDMLSVTTTMEVGVDIGSLQAIYQGNMPPTRYNYQQRVGRAGRRGQAYSAALTFCRGRSHDNYYYSEGAKYMTSGKPADPTLSVDPNVGGQTNLVILKRIILKHIIMTISANNPNWINNPPSTCGQLGGTDAVNGDWRNDVRPEIAKYIQNNLNTTIEKDIVDYYTEQFSISSSDKQSILDWLQNDVLNEMDDAIINSASSDNAQAIAEAGLLPMYGMPTSIRNFYHQGEFVNNQGQEKYTGVIDRPVEQSIVEFAPGAIKTKDGGEYTCAGLTIPLGFLNECSSQTDYNGKINALDPLEHIYSLTLNSNGEIIDIKPGYNDTSNNTSIVRLVIPKAYRTAKIEGNKGETINEDDSRSNYTPVTLWVNAYPTNPKAIPNGAGKWEIWNGNQNNVSDVWYVNTNNGLLFSGQYAWQSRNNRGRQQAIWPKFKAPRVTASIPGIPNFIINDYLDNSFQTEGNAFDIALGAKKVTDILCLSLDPNSIPRCLNLNCQTGNKSAIVAAFYSAASLIQRVFAEDIDIDPNEIEISEVKIDGNGMPSVYMNDKAPNGAGFVSMLCSPSPTGILKLIEIMEDIVSPNPSSPFIQSLRNHAQGCKTSCPKCLNTYYNRGFHHVLDWRLGMDVIMLLLDKTYEMGYNDLSSTPYGDLANVLNEIGNRVANANPAGLTYQTNDGKDWETGSFKSGGRGGAKVERLVHPLWNVESQEQKDGYRAQNSFTLSRVVKQIPDPVTPIPTIVSNGTVDTSTSDSNVKQSSGHGSLS